jgi:hypothetical protein
LHVTPEKTNLELFRLGFATSEQSATVSQDQQAKLCRSVLDGVVNSRCSRLMLSADAMSGNVLYQQIVALSTLRLTSVACYCHGAASLAGPCEFPHAPNSGIASCAHGGAATACTTDVQVEQYECAVTP